MRWPGARQRPISRSMLGHLEGDNRISMRPFHGRHAGLDQGNHDKIGRKNGETRPDDTPRGCAADRFG